MPCSVRASKCPLHNQSTARHRLPDSIAGRLDRAMQVASLYRYPVKGLSPEALESVALGPGETLPFDRAYAIENGPGRFDPDPPRHLPKINFLMLMRDERLATLRSAVRGRHRNADHPARRQAGGARPAHDAARAPAHRAVLGRLHEGRAARAAEDRQRAGPQLLRRGAKCVHIVNLASVRELERVVGRPVDPLRFRANLYLDGLEPWAEFGWLDKEIGVGPAQADAFSRARSDARQPTSTRPRARATWPSRRTCSAAGATRTSASTPRSSAADKSPSARRCRTIVGAARQKQIIATGTAVNRASSSFCRLGALGARAPHGTAQKFRLLVRLLEALAPTLVCRPPPPGHRLLLAIRPLAGGLRLAGLRLLMRSPRSAAVVAVVEAVAVAALIAAEGRSSRLASYYHGDCCLRAGLRDGCLMLAGRRLSCGWNEAAGNRRQQSSPPSSSPKSSPPSPAHALAVAVRPSPC